uniref:RNA-directed RNA polymerase n=1 Tax=Beihai toti-like virus 2 TaxID=1922732 RepID=A0A1L3KF40_9VIRU|nr:hypothetical protein 2 [Beihai toti-like virus 2]
MLESQDERVPGRRTTVRPWSGDLARPLRSQLLVALDGADVRRVVGQYGDAAALLPNVEKLDGLRRARIRVPPAFPRLGEAFTPALYMHYRSLTILGHVQLSKTLLGVLSALEKRLRKDESVRGSEDDCVRQALKRLSTLAFERVYSKGPGWMFLVHLHNLGGKRAYTHEQVNERVKQWVSEGRVFEHEEWWQKRLDSVFAGWGGHAASTPHLSFADFCNDPVRWGTSGGAPRVEFQGDKYRSKWAWAFRQLFGPDGRADPQSADLYQAARAAGGDVARVALKEQSDKTREIITTPMASYLRQTYLLYRWGKPNLPSPISNDAWLPEYQRMLYAWYGAIDAENFDHCAPGAFVLSIIERLGALDSETAAVAAEELKHLRSLRVLCPDGTTFRWKKGVLSGWRLTSLLGTLATHCAAQWVTEAVGAGGMIWGALGDDLTLASNSFEVSSTTLVKAYEEFGLRTNPAKTTAGASGEFLRKVYTPHGVFAYPGLGLKSIFWKTPWAGDTDPTAPDELSSMWLTWLSRLLPFRRNDDIVTWVRKECVADLRRWNPALSAAQYEALLATPIPAGGAGCIEMAARPDKWVSAKPVTESRAQGFFSHFGLVRKGEMRLHKAKVLDSLSAANQERLVDQLQRLRESPHRARLPRDINLTTALWRWFVDDAQPATEIAKTLKIQLPRGLRVAGKNAILGHILGSGDHTVVSSSIQTTPETDVSLSYAVNSVIATYIQQRRNANTRDVRAAGVQLGQHRLYKTSAVRGTW